jgi:hypothetical protein
MAAISEDVMRGEGRRGRRMDGDEKRKEMREEEKASEIITQRTEIAAEKHNRPGQRRTERITEQGQGRGCSITSQLQRGFFLFMQQLGAKSFAAGKGKRTQRAATAK